MTNNNNMQSIGTLAALFTSANNMPKLTLQEAERRQAERKNAQVGKLNELDGIDCPICKNKGFIYYVDDDHPLVTMKKCQCMAKRDSIRYAKQSGLKDLLDKKLNSFIVKSSWQQDMKNLCVEYARNSTKRWLCILGQSGTGKTHLVSSIANEYIAKNIEVRYAVWPDMMATIKQEMFENKDSVSTQNYKYKTVPVLYIDDLFKGKITERDISLTYEIINYRYNNNLLTLITSEYLLAQLSTVDEAIAGRIREMCGKYFMEISRDSEKNYRFQGNAEI